MENYVARALQVTMLSRNQLDLLHKRENIRGHLIPNWNIQKCFSLGTIKEKYGIPVDDLSAQQAFSERATALISSHNLLGKDEWRIRSGNVESTHCFDWAIFNLNDSLGLRLPETTQTTRRRRLRDLASDEDRNED